MPTLTGAWVAGDGVVLNALTAPLPGVGDAEDKKGGTYNYQDDNAKGRIQQGHPPPLIGLGGRLKRGHKKTARSVVSGGKKRKSQFLRRHYPDQVLRSAASGPPSQPGITKLPPESY